MEAKSLFSCPSVKTSRSIICHKVFKYFYFFRFFIDSKVTLCTLADEIGKLKIKAENNSIFKTSRNKELI